MGTGKFNAWLNPAMNQRIPSRGIQRGVEIPLVAETRDSHRPDGPDGPLSLHAVYSLRRPLTEAIFKRLGI